MAQTFGKIFFGRIYKILTAILLLLSVHLTAQATVYYVTYDGKPVADGWQVTTTLDDALGKALANDEIWIQGSDNPEKAYTVPANGYTIKSGVKLYGGFMGTEKSISERKYVAGKRYKPMYRTLLSGDTDGHDIIEDAYFIFPEGEATNHRGDNARHVLILDMSPTGNNNTYPTIVNGLTIARGHAKEDVGGGIYIKGDNTNGGAFRIEQCFFLANYASRGGAIYISGEVKHRADDNRIDRCAFFNNAAGTRTLPVNQGAGIYAVGDVNIVNTVVYNNANGGINATEASKDGVQVINTTITRNSASGIEGTIIKVSNTVVWGNTTISAAYRPGEISHCAFIGATEGTADNNVSLDAKNNDANGPNFKLPSLKTGYDSDFSILTTLYPDWDWESQGETRLVDKGDNDIYNTTLFGNEDLASAPRVRGNAIDIGAYEFQPVAGSNIRYVRQGATGDGTSWEKASGNLQNMIDALAETGGEVWVAKGTYYPTAYQLSNKIYTASFRMRDKVSVYGGFSDTNPESSKIDREKGKMSWEYKNETILQGLDYQTPTSWGAISSSSRHVVWFAPLATTADGEEVPFSAITYLEGVTVMGGYASGGNNEEDFLTDRGAGIYMKGQNASVINCIVKNNYATGSGGGIYIDGEGSVQRSLLFNNVSNADGGAIYANGASTIRRCMITNNKGRKGSGAYLKKTESGGRKHPQLSTCVVSNNTSAHNGAVYCDKGGVIVHNTIVNNLCTKSTDTADSEAAQTSGLYVDEYALLVNSVIWNNRFGERGKDIPMYVKNPSVETVRFLHNAISGTGNAIWNNTYQEETIFLSGTNTGTADETGPNFDEDSTRPDNPLSLIGAQTQGIWLEAGNVNYYWNPATGSALWSAGLEQGRMPPEVTVVAEMDITGELYANKPTIGASYTEEMKLVYDADTDGNKLILYVSSSSMDKDDNGRSWDHPYRSLNKAIEYFARLSADVVKGRTLEIRVMEGTIWPRYSFVNEDPKSATILLKTMASGARLRLVGGYHRTSATTAKRDPLTYRSVIEGNREGTDIKEGSYHVVTAESGTRVEMDGFHIVNGYAAGWATIQHGAGLLAYDKSDVTLINCIFEDNTAVSGAAIYAEGESQVTLRNCVVNNNTNTTSTEPIAYCQKLNLEHVSFLNNEGAMPAGLGTTSFALNNTSGNSDFNDSFATTGEDGARHFANPSNDVGAHLGFDTYLGGYAVYRPLTSSQEASNRIINQAQGTSAENKQDITANNDRDLGGVADLGAYEAILPKKGRVYYVRTTADGGDNNHDGLSWATAFAEVRKAVETAADSSLEKGEKPQVWVAAGTYSQAPKNDSQNCFEILDGVNVYGAFPKTGNPGIDDRHPFISNYIYHDGTYKAEDYETILQPSGTSSTRRVLGQEDIYNPFYLTQYALTDNGAYKYVGPGNGDIELIQAGYYPATGGEYQFYEEEGYKPAAPEIATHWLCDADVTYKYFSKADGTYGTDRFGSNSKRLIKVGYDYGNFIIKTGVFWITYEYYEETTAGNGDYAEFKSAGYYEVNPTVGGTTYYQGYYYELKDAIASKHKGTHIYATKGYNKVGTGYGNYNYVAEHYENVGTGNGSYIKQSSYEYTYPTCWDGFTIRNGYLDSKKINFLGNSQFNGQNGYPEVKTAGRRNGGAGVALFKNVTLRNSIVYGNTNKTENGTDLELRAGGLYADGGTVVNCYILNNTLGQGGQYPSYGGGAYLYSGRVYNTVISENNSYATHTDGAGIFIENGEFFNNTITGNVSHGTTRGNGGICIWQSGTSSTLYVYNCISLNNTGFKQDSDKRNIGYADVATSGGSIYCYNSVFGNNITNVSGTGKKVQFYNCQKGTTAMFNDITSAIKDYRLNGTSGINIGENTPVINGDTIDLFEFTDMDYTDRIKDCRVDVGAYERSNQDKNTPDTRNGKAIYYVTQNGAGSSNASSLDNAACASKLQEVLYAAGEYAVDHPDTEVIVKVAGYMSRTFTYHVYDLADEKNPQSYSYVIPYGVTVMGGYNENATDWDDNDYADNTDKNGEAKRNITLYPTVFSAIKKGNLNTQDIRGFHTVTFDIPDTWKEGDKLAVIDGIYLEDGSATSLAGGNSKDTQGGAAIVPAGAHVRNCVIQNNEAKRGGGLYVLPGGWVTGCVITGNTAEENGGGLYAKEEAESEHQHAYFVSNTIAENSASRGGGIYVEEGAAMTLNSVIWGNKANSDQNISARNVKDKESDKVLDDMTGTTSEKWFPFNSCYVEGIELPGNYENAKMESSLETYFAGSNYYLKYYSPLIDHGMMAEMQTYLTENKHVSTHDILGELRRQTTDQKMDVGAFAFKSTVLEKELLKRIFVSQRSSHVLAESEKDKVYTGKTFYTPFTWLGDALEYIRKARQDIEEARSTVFEIFVAEGLYTPKYRRQDNGTGMDLQDLQDLRLNTFSIPPGVKIYGGFTGEELYSSNDEDLNPITEIRFKKNENEPETSVSFIPLDDTKVKELVEKRKEYGSDFNENNVTEAWEMGYQTILSGNINVSDGEQNVYHVVYSEKDADFKGTQTVLLDGLTIQDGFTLRKRVTGQDEKDEWGGGIYSDGVDYTIANCRLLKNQAVKGGAAWIRNANLTLVNSMISGNKTWNSRSTSEAEACGGGVFVTSTGTGNASLHAVNTLWPNNESEGKGGAIGAENNTLIDLMNNTFVMNKAAQDAVLYHTATTKDHVKLINTVMWSNEGGGEKDTGDNVDMTYSACDRDYDLKDGTTLFGPDNGYHNIFLSDDNLAIDGPRYAKPATATGVEGYDLNNQWSPIAVSPLTDNGNGTRNKENNGYEPGEPQAYRDWFTTHAQDYAGQYMLSETYARYSGPNAEDGGPDVRPIDIGVHEYQYRMDFSTMDKIYVATQSSGTGSGENWQNATDDLRGALIGAANPTSNQSQDGIKSVYIKGGDYPWAIPTSANSVFPVYIGGKEGLEWNKLQIVGSCIGSGDRQDFSKPTVLKKHQYVTTPQYLMEIDSRTGKEISITGLTFSNTETNTTGGVSGHSGIHVTENTGKLEMKDVAFRMNSSNGMEISSCTGNMLLVNTLFADNGGTGLSVASNDRITLVNTTFANNGKEDMSETLKNVYNSTSWNNGTQHMIADAESVEEEDKVHFNKVFAPGTANEGIETGPNFYDPLKAEVMERDYRIRPSLTLLGKGSNKLYLTQAMGRTEAEAETETIPETERELNNERRLVDENIDIGAYEYRAPLQPIVYVKDGVVSDNNDGSSWDRALDDLQNAANLAGIYATEQGKTAYVFVDNNMNQEEPLKVQLGNVRIYGGMSGEVTAETGTEEIVEDLLRQREGLLEKTVCSQLTGTVEINGDNCVVDGFEVTGTPVVRKGMLATSVVNGDVSGTAEAEGILYNTLVKGDVSGVKTVNVTATGTIAAADGNGNNRTGAMGDNPYVKEENWNYQLKEDSEDIDAEGTIDIADYIRMAGHNRDIAGNRRIRKTVDKGCFETWNITREMTADHIVTEDDYPHGKSVVYVRHTAGTDEEGGVYDGGAELLIKKAYTSNRPFNPGFLLLEHHAGLRANGQPVMLENFAVERNIGTSGTDMAVMPFEVIQKEGNATCRLYNADLRAKYDYQYSDTDGAWKDTRYDAARDTLTIGWLLEGQEGSKVRFYGNYYEENTEKVPEKDIILVKKNFNEAWTSASDKGNRFTHKENMSWNLFGSPYLCAMNYSDMEYGRVMYGYLDGAYTTFNTIPENTKGYIPAGDAVFTQTATLKSGEELKIKRPEETNGKSGKAYQGSEDMTVSLSHADARTEGKGAEDRLQLKAVPADESRSDFDISSDGVKWMSAGRPQVYARQGGGRYSLLSAVNIEGEVSVGVSLPEAGMYTFSIPEDCDKDAYETVILKDKQTGRLVDLLENRYDFSVTASGVVEGRFSICFNRMTDDLADNSLHIYSPKRHTVRLEGLSSGDRITAYTLSGTRMVQRMATDTAEEITVEAEVVLIEVKHDGKTIVKKIKL